MDNYVHLDNNNIIIIIVVMSYTGCVLCYESQDNGQRDNPTRTHAHPLSAIICSPNIFRSIRYDIIITEIIIYHHGLSPFER